jgi:hypothetical protein
MKEGYVFQMVKLVYTADIYRIWEMELIKKFILNKKSEKDNGEVYEN